MMYEYLWTIFRPGTEIFSTLDGHNCIYKLISGDYIGTDKVNAFKLQLRSIDVDGAYLGYRTSQVLIHCFGGTKPLKNLDAFPASYHPFAADVREQLTQRGSQFRDFHTNNPSYEAYKGIIMTKEGWCDDKRNAYLTFNANESADLDPLEGVTFKSPLEFKDKEHDEPKMYGRSYCGTGMIWAEEEQKQSRKDALKAGSVPLSEDLLYLCSPQVKGYCLKTKKWATFYIDSIQEIKWNEEAFESLVLPTDYKRLILSFVESQIKNKETFDDVIEGKGRGLIMLLQGSSGVGKILTAEALADRLRKPLYALSAGELGHTPDTLEKRLTTILDIAAKWDAVLLLDESDVFLEARSADNLARNGVVAIFLRLLEYFRGILFLTTNRVHGMDPAFRSRIHLTINYPKLKKQARRQIWERLVGVGRGVSEEEFEKLADWEVNGREVKNIVKAAQLLAAHEGVDLAMEHIETVVRVMRGEIGEGDEDDEDDEKEVRKVPKETVAFNPFPEDVDVMEVSDQVEGGSASKRLRRS